MGCKKEYNPDGVTELVNAIIEQAVDDYADAIKGRSPRWTEWEPEETIEELDKFFYSDWFSLLTNAEPEICIKAAKEREETKEETRVATEDSREQEGRPTVCLDITIVQDNKREEIQDDTIEDTRRTDPELGIWSTVVYG